MRGWAWTTSVATIVITACSPQPGQVTCAALRSAPYAQEIDAYQPMRVGAPLPATADAALAALDQILTPAQKAQVRCAADPVALHFSLGRWIRNEWGLYDKSALARDMIAKGFIDPDDMSSAIIAVYAGRLRGARVDFAHQAAKDRAYWTRRGVDVGAELQRLSQ